MNTEPWAVVVTLIAQVIGSLTPVFMKKAAGSIVWSSPASLINRDLMVSITAQFLSMVLFVIALKGGELSFIYPLVSTVYIWSSFLSIKLLGERMNAKKWSGIGLIIAGVVSIGFGS